MSSSSRKKQKSEVDVTASLACHALAIVLQHWMIPNIGWYSDSCEQFTRRLEMDVQSQSQGRQLNETFLNEHRRQCQNNLQNADLIIALLPANQVSNLLSRHAPIDKIIYCGLIDISRTERACDYTHQ